MLIDQLHRLLRPVRPWMVYLAGAIPALLLVLRIATGDLGVDPVKTVERTLGETALQLIVAGLCVSPLRRIAGLNLIRFRRQIGVLAFVYAALHLLTWVTLDLQFRWAEIGADLVKRPYIIVGMLAFLMLMPLAATSNNAAIRRLGAGNWQRLHRLTYPAALLAALHYIWLVKAWPLEPLVYMAAVLILLALRLRKRQLVANPAR